MEQRRPSAVVAANRTKPPTCPAISAPALPLKKAGGSRLVPPKMRPSTSPGSDQRVALPWGKTVLGVAAAPLFSRSCWGDRPRLKAHDTTPIYAIANANATIFEFLLNTVHDKDHNNGEEPPAVYSHDRRVDGHFETYRTNGDDRETAEIPIHVGCCPKWGRGNAP